MAVWHCGACTAAYSVGAPQCPQCGSADPIKETSDMAKLTVHGGPTNDADTADTPEEEPSPGSSSETSSSKPQSSSGPGTSSRRSRARTTENPS